MRRHWLAAAAALAATWLAAPPSARADGCLQKFSCQVYGECRFPCLDEIMGTQPAAPPAALDTQPTGALPREGKAVAKDEPVRSKHRIARRDSTKPARRSVAKAVTEPAGPHLVAARDVTSLDQLAGKPVSFGPPGSPAQELGRQLFAKLDIKVQETPLDIDNALDGVATGDVAAVLLVKPKDVARVEKLPAAEHELAVPGGKSAQAAAPVVARDEDKTLKTGRSKAE